MDSFLGVAHWQGCYFKSGKPFLLDGADEVRRLGSKIIKACRSLCLSCPISPSPPHCGSHNKDHTVQISCLSQIVCSKYTHMAETHRWPLTSMSPGTTTPGIPSGPWTSGGHGPLLPSMSPNTRTGKNCSTWILTPTCSLPIPTWREGEERKA